MLYMDTTVANTGTEGKTWVAETNRLKQVMVR